MKRRVATFATARRARVFFPRFRKSYCSNGCYVLGEIALSSFVPPSNWVSRARFCQSVSNYIPASPELSGSMIPAYRQARRLALHMGVRFSHLSYL